MDDHDGVEVLQRRHIRLQLVRVEWRELVDAGMEQEALEAEHAGVMQGAKIRVVPRDRAAPEPDIDERLVIGNRALEFQRLDVDGGRDASSAACR